MRCFKKMSAYLPFAVFSLLVLYYFYYLIVFLRGQNVEYRALVGFPAVIWLVYDLWLRPPPR